MASASLSEAQKLNYNNLLALRDAAREDLVRACCRFGLRRAELKAIGELQPSEITAIVINAGDEALFVPRDDLASLLSAPPAVLPVLASARERVAAKPSSQTAAAF
jgi:hypothetical protein